MVRCPGLAGVQLGTIAMVDLIWCLSIFVVGVGRGYYLRDRISRKRRHLESKRSRRSQRGSPTLGISINTPLAVGLFNG
jgi:hypothetical protein